MLPPRPPPLPRSPAGVPHPGHRRRGGTLLELATVLLLVGVVLSLVAPAVGRQLDGAAVRGAREAAVGMVGRARAEAVAAGEARFGVAPDGDSLWVEAGDTTVATLHLRREYGVDLGPEGASTRVLSFGFLGFGSAASRTLTFERGSAGRTLTLSAYGRVRRW